MARHRPHRIWGPHSVIARTAHTKGDTGPPHSGVHAGLYVFGLRLAHTHAAPRDRTRRPAFSMSCTISGRLRDGMSSFPPGRYLTTYMQYKDGFYFTGDGAYRDKDGYYWITGRVDGACVPMLHATHASNVRATSQVNHAAVLPLHCRHSDVVAECTHHFLSCTCICVFPA